MILHGGLQKIHSGKAINQILWCEQHDQCCTAADDDRINENAERLYKACFGRAVTFCRGSAPWSRSEPASFEKQTTLYTVHQNSTKTAGCHLTKSEGFLKNAVQTQKESDGG